MALHVTQCPSCDSTFNTSARLLDAAQGLVRCGACLSVFEARDNFVSLQDSEGTDSAGADHEESVFLSGQDDYLDVARFIRTASGLNDTVQTGMESATAPEAEVETGTGTETDTETETEAEAEAENSVTNPTEVFAASTMPPMSAGNRYDFDALESVIDADSTQSEIRPPEPATVAPADDIAESDFMRAISEALPEPALEAAVAETGPETTEAEASAEPTVPALPLVETESESKEELRARLGRMRLIDQQEALEDLSDANISAIRQVADPLELPHQPPQRRFWRNVSLSLISLLLLLTLAGQFLWERVEVLALDDNLRPLYQQACELLNCRLPLLEDLAHLQVENLTVRSHPDAAGALQVTAVLRNQAAFQQAFPQLQMRFSNQSQRLVASRTFMPQDYLPPALHSIVNMPVNTPVQISLDLLDPGADAINYELRLVSRRQ